MNIYEIRHATRRELISFLTSMGCACYSDEPTKLLRETAFELVRNKHA